MTSHSFADNLEERLIDFAVRIVRLSTRLPRTPAGKHIALQILRSGTPLRRITVKLEAPKATLISYTNCASS